MIAINVKNTDEFALLNRVCKDPKFLTKGRASADLRMLCQFPGEDHESLKRRKEQLGRNPSDRIHDVHVALQEFFDAHPGEPKRMVVQQAEGRRGRLDLYQVGLIDNVVSRSATQLFWEPYRSSSVVIAYGKPLFVAGKKQPKGPYTTFVREVGINTEADLNRLPKTSIIHNLNHRTEEYTFVTAGEVDAIFTLTRFFTPRPWALDMAIQGLDRGATLVDRSPATGQRSANVIVIGTPRTNGFMVEYQNSLSEGSFAFTLGEQGICDRHGKVIYQEHSDPKNQRIRIAYALVTRLKGVKDPHSAVTLIASHSGRAIQRVAELLTDDAELDQVVTSTLPEEFQIVVEVKVLGKGEEGGPWHVHRKWPGKTKSITITVPSSKR